MTKPPGIDRATFDRLAGEYRRQWKVDVCAARADGMIAYTAGADTIAHADAAEWRQVRGFAIAEGLRWGEPTVSYGPQRMLLWAVPLMRNMELLGGLIASLPERRLLPEGASAPTMDVRRACTVLRELAERENLTNAALLEVRRWEYSREQQRADAIHTFKRDTHFNLRQMYLREEPDLIAAVRRGDRGEARAVLNRILTAILHHTGERFDLVKSFFMELVVTVCRTAVEAGGAPEELLGVNYTTIAELAKIESAERLAPWLHQTLERILDSIYRHRRSTRAVLLAKAMEFMEANLARDLSRNEVARAAHLSPSHFSRLFHDQAGRSFSDVLNRMRINRAAELLARTDKSIGAIAQDCGFGDQSYFTKVFQRFQGTTPRRYREQHRNGEVG